ncbi:AAA family ATPase [Kushneria aurantia]|uniref:AAA family ATPase n=1 Tax=Kushneria aurantia TaxID=504092 RepID=A0ABV6FYM7_9GAMM|nr:AAA family ATPase [Kushneria aurantia]
MRILAIQLHNLASLGGPWTLDFTTEPLADAGLFAITGPTGAGKSTLLDALCLALYGNTPRLRRAPQRDSSAPDVAGETLTTADPRTLLRRGETSGYASVDFRGCDGHDYRAVWQVRRARQRAAGRLQGAEQRLISLPDGTLITDRKREFDQLLPQRLGLTFDQFTRAVLLAQSEFGSFLRADDNQRGELLEKLTDTTIYSRLSIAAYQRSRDCQEKVRELESRLDDQPPADTEARRALEENARQSAQQLAVFEQRDRALQTEKQWLDSDRRLERHWRSADEAQRSAEADLAERAEERRLCQRLDALAPQRHLFERRAECDRQLARLDDQQREQQIAHQQALSDRNTASEAASSCEQTLSATRAGRQQQLPRIEACAEAEQRRQHLADRIDSERQQLARLESHNETCQSALAHCRQMQAEAQQELTALRQRRADSQQDADTPDAWREQTRQKEEAKRHQRHRLETLRQAHQQYQRLMSQLTPLEQAQHSDRAALDAGAVETASAGDRAAHQERALGDLQQRVERLRAARSDSVTALRAGLEADSPCPVCGSLDHPWHDAPPATPEQAMLKATEAEEQRQLETLRRARDADEAQWRRLRGRDEETRSRIEQRRQQLERLTSDTHAAEQTLRACDAFDALPESEPDRVLHKRIETLASEEDALNKKLAQFDADLRREQPLRERLNQLALKEAGLERDRHHGESQRETLETALAPREREIAELDEWLDAQLDEYADSSAWRQRLEAAVDTCASQLDRARQLLQDRQQALALIERQLTDLSQRQQDVRHDRDALLADIRRWRAEHDDIDDDVLGELLAVDEVRHHQLAAALAELDRQRDQNRLLARERAELLAEHRRNRPARTELLPDDAQQLIDQRDTLCEALDERQRTLHEQLETARQARDEANHALREDERRRERASELQQTLERSREELTRWGRISGLIGSADGRVFRRIAQAWNLDRLIEFANLHLERLARRYRLERGGSELGLLVVDTDMADERRSVHSLSGGETFLVSLALALALSSMTSHQLNIETLFIDEGFGSLDPHSLAQAMDALDALQSQGRRVGVISHVQEMQERIATRIDISPCGNGQSEIRVLRG